MTLTLIVIALALLNLALLVALLLRKQDRSQDAQLQLSLNTVAEQLGREMHHTRQELTQTLATAAQTTQAQNAQEARTQHAQMDQFTQRLSLLQTTLSDTLTLQLQTLSESNSRRMSEIRNTLEAQLTTLQNTNTAKLDEMRKTVDEKLQSTLEARLSASFQQVAQRLEQVHKGLGEMQTLAQGVGDLQRLLGNVKTRGVFGEVQLEALLEQVLTPQQYAKQVQTHPRSTQRVDFAVCMPGRQGDGVPLWLPIDAKFPRDDYERLLDAQDRADPVAVQVATKALDARIRTQAKSIAESYLAPPHTTDFAILFLPIESLYAQALRSPGLMESLQRDYHVTLAGPTTLLAMLNSLHMGFRTLALEQQASEVWKVLGTVKTEFERYGEWVARIREQVQKASDTLEKADTRTNKIRNALKNIESVATSEEPYAQAPLLGLDTDAD